MFSMSKIKTMITIFLIKPKFVNNLDINLTNVKKQLVWINYKFITGYLLSSSYLVICFRACFY